MRVLLVEDELLVRELVEEALADAGAEVQTADSGGAAKLLLEQRSFRADVLVIDINLGPGCDGFAVSRLARRFIPGVKVVYITGHAGHLSRAGVEGSVLIPKPFDPDQVAQMVVALGEA
jgi:two-component system, cell cycle response regulator CpdR